MLHAEGHVKKQNRKKRKRSAKPKLGPAEIYYQRRLAAVRDYQSIRSKQDGTVSLSEAIKWLSRLDNRGTRSIDTDPDRLRNSVDELKDALFNGALGGDAAHPIIMVADDQDICPFTEEDISEAKHRPSDDPRKANMYDEIGPATELLNRLWVSRELLTKLFRKMLWRVPDWLASENSSNASNLPVRGAFKNSMKGVSQSQRPGRKPGQGSYAEIDLPLISEMAELLRQLKAASPEEAAKLVADRAHGNATFESKVDRLAKRFRERHRDG
jgi:hypothetical protein